MNSRQQHPRLMRRICQLVSRPPSINVKNQELTSLNSPTTNSTDVFKRQQHWLQQRLRKWLWKKYGRTLGRHTFFTDDRLRGQYGLAILPCYASRNR